MPEILVPFASRQDWSEWLAAHPGAQSLAERVATDVRIHGFVEPITGLRRAAADVQIDEGRLRETLSAHETNSRKRALLLVLAAAAHARGWSSRGDVTVHVPEATTRVGRMVASRFAPPLAAPPASSRPRVEALGLHAASADAVVVVDAFDSVETPAAAWAELRRVLRPGGLVIASVNFSGERPMDAPFMGPSGRCGWSVIPGLKAQGFSEAAMVLVASSQHGIAANGEPGVMVLIARREGGAEDVPLLPSVSWTGALPEKLCLLVALPRSGTTLTTALFDVHSRFDAVYEPWNAKLLEGAEDARIETILERAKLGREAGRFLFVKETAAQQAYVDNMRRLFEATAIPADRRVLMLCRKPAHTFMSEIERRKEWWGDDVELNQHQFDLWCAKTRQTLRAMLDLIRRANGNILCYERMAEEPAAMLARLAEVVGFEAEPAQLEFEKHLDKRKVRGDLNVSKNPEAISTDSIRRREAREAAVLALCEASAQREWFTAFERFHAAARRHGVCLLADLPAEVVEPLQGPDAPELRRRVS
jgi:hypothetical protein